MTIVGTRPEIIKLSRVISEFDKHTNHILVHTGQNYDYELNEIFFTDLNIRKPDHFLNASNENTAQMIGNIISKSDEIMKKELPDAILLYGDTNSCLSVISAKRNKIPIFHMEAGNRSFDQRVPEEINRKIVDHLSDINLVLTEHARKYLLKEGIQDDRIFKSGSHMPEVLKHYKISINQSTVLDLLKLKKFNYFLVSMHREENVDDQENLKSLLDTLNEIANYYKLPIIVSVHPRTQKRLNDLKKIKLNQYIQFLKPFGFCDYVKLQLEAKCVISDSGTITEEASILNLPAITIRNSHERPEGMDSGTLIMSGLKYQNVLDSISIILSQHDYEEQHFGRIKDFEELYVSKKILRIVRSYIEFVNENVWKKRNIN